jgi:hypothetical protein
MKSKIYAFLNLGKHSVNKNKSLVLAMCFAAFVGRSQGTYVSSVEDVGLTSGQVYNGSSGGTGFQSGHAFFPTVWDTSFGGFWSAGWVASAVHDSSTSGGANQYGCIAYNGHGGSNAFAVGTTFGNLVIRFTDSLIGKTPMGLYVTNSTYAYKSMRNGDMFAKKFGDTTGTHCGCAQGTYPDWFKLTIRKYFGGVMTNDSLEVYLADYRFSNSAQDYILKAWTWIDLSTLGNTDSLAFFLHSSDNGAFGMNTPAYFCVDDLTLKNVVGITEYSNENGLQTFPNPANGFVNIEFNTPGSEYVNLKIIDVTGLEMFEQGMMSAPGRNKLRVGVSDLSQGMYYVVITTSEGTSTKKLLKQ